VGLRTAGPAQGQPAVLLIEILPGGFNPPVCTINRDARIPVKFVNRDTKPRRIVVDVPYIPEPGEFLYDSGVVPPGGTQEGEWRFNEVNDVVYRDHDNPGLTGRIVVPISPNAATDCERSDTGPVTPGGDLCARVLATSPGCRFIPGLANG
jgi:hypothetical protein